MAIKLRTLLGRQLKQEKLTFGRIFAVQIILFFAIYGIMLMPRFSTDSYTIFFCSTGDLDAFLGSGRTGTYVLYRALLGLGINSVTFSPIFTAVFILTAAWSAAVLLSLLKPCFPNPNWLTVLLLEFGVMLAYANIYFAELYFFSDVALMYTFALFFMTLALLLFFHRNQIIGTILSMACLYFSLSFYQAFLGFFIIFGFMILLIRHDVPGTQWKKQAVKPLVLDLLRLAAGGGGGSIATVLTINLLDTIGFASGRGPSLQVTDIFNSIQQAVVQFISYYPSGYPFYLTGLMKVVFILSGPVLLCLLADSFPRGRRKRYPFFSAAVTLLALLAGLLSVFAPHLVSKSVWLPPRSICSFFAVFTVMAVVIGYNYTRNRKVMPYTGTVVMLLLLAVNIVGIQGIALDQIEVNRRDKVEAEEMVRCIQKYEAETGQSVDTISWRPDSRYTWTHPGVKYSFMDMNVRAGARSWSLIDCISYYAGRRFRSETMPDDIWSANFMGQEWDSFRPEEQIRLDGNKMYLMVY